MPVQNFESGFLREQNSLLLQRVIPVFWLGIVFVLLFCVLDFVVHRPLFSHFFFYRLVLVYVFLLCLALLHFRSFQRHAFILIVLAILAATLIISLMTVHLGGFSSSYFLGIVLTVSFALSVLPLRVRDIALIGGLVFVVYLGCLISAGYPHSRQDIIYLLDNLALYFAIIAVVMVKSHDATRHRQQIWLGRESLRQLNNELTIYTGDLEFLIQQRLQQLEELKFRFSDLYENIEDMVVLVADNGRPLFWNRRFVNVFASRESVDGVSFFDLFVQEHQNWIRRLVQARTRESSPIRAMEARMRTASGQILDVEISGNWIGAWEPDPCWQLVIRNITRRKEMERQVLEASRLVDHSRRAAIIGLAKLAEYRDRETGAHLERIREYTRILTTALADTPGLQHLISPSFLEDITLSSVLHDIGKVGIPDAILCKPDRLEEEEFEIMKKHCVYGRDVLANACRDAGNVTFLTMGQEITHYHHEKWDGSGYPEGKSGTDIPLSARIVALADVYDALTSRRCYKQSLAHKRARDIIVAERGRHFDPQVVDAFLAMEQEFMRIRMKILLR